MSTNFPTDPVPPVAGQLTTQEAPPAPPALGYFVKTRTGMVLTGLALLGSLAGGFVLLQSGWLPWIKPWTIMIAFCVLIATIAIVWLICRHRYAAGLERYLHSITDQLTIREADLRERESQVAKLSQRVSELERESDAATRRRAQRDFDLVKKRLGGLMERRPLRIEMEMSGAETGYSQDQVDEFHDIQIGLGGAERFADKELQSANDELRGVLGKFLNVFNHMGDSSNGGMHVRPLDPDRQQMQWRSWPVVVEELTTGERMELAPDQRAQYVQQHPETVFVDLPTLLALQQQVVLAIKRVETRAHDLVREWDLISADR